LGCYKNKKREQGTGNKNSIYYQSQFVEFVPFV